MGSQRFHKTARSGGASGAMDTLDVTIDSLVDEDKTAVTEAGIKYDYWYDDDNGGADDGINLVAPDEDNGVPYVGDGRWVLDNIRCGALTITGLTCSGAAGVGALTASSIVLAAGAALTEFSTDGTLADNSDTKGSTMKAIKTYVDTLMNVRVPEYKTVTVWAASMVATTTNGASFGSFEYPTNDNMKDYFAFDASTEEFVYFSIPLDENWDRSTIKFKFHWAPADGGGASESETVEIEVSSTAISDNDPLDAAMGTPQVISDAVVAGTDGDLHVTDATPSLTVGGTPALDDSVEFLISRNVSGTDNMVGDMWLFKAVMQYRITNTVSAW